MVHIRELYILSRHIAVYTMDMFEDLVHTAPHYWQNVCAVRVWGLHFVSRIGSTYSP